MPAKPTRLAEPDPPVGQGPNGLGHVLPKFPDVDNAEFTRQLCPDPIFVAVDCKYLLLPRVGQNAEGRLHEYRPETEIGIASLDMRYVLWKTPTVPPGDRGFQWSRFIRTVHYKVDGYEDGVVGDTWIFSDPDKCAFARSDAIKKEQRGHAIASHLQFIGRMNRTDSERREDAHRNVIFLTWDSAHVERTFWRLGLKYFNEPLVKVWDLQKGLDMTKLFGRARQADMAHAMERLGLRFIDQSRGCLVGCAGNDANFIIQIMLASYFATPQQVASMLQGNQIGWLPFTWNTAMLDFDNPPLGKEPRRRPTSLKNDSSVDQIRDESAWRHGW